VKTRCRRSLLGNGSGFRRLHSFKRFWTKNHGHLKVFAVLNLHAAERKEALQKADDDDFIEQQLRLFRSVLRSEELPLDRQAAF
jgi:hypothetical protein